MQFLLQLLSSISQNVKVWFKKHALKLFHYSSILKKLYLDHRFELKSDLKAIVEMTKWPGQTPVQNSMPNC